MLKFSKLRAWCNPAGVLLILAAIFIGAALAKAGGSRPASERPQAQTAAAGCCQVDKREKQPATIADAAGHCPSPNDAAKDATLVVATDLKLTNDRQCTSSGECKSSRPCESASAPIDCDNECAEFIAPIVNLWAARKGVAVDSPEARAFAKSLVSIHSDDRREPPVQECTDYAPPAERRPANNYSTPMATYTADSAGPALPQCGQDFVLAADLSQARAPSLAESQMEILRGASAEMDETAKNLERSGLFEAADRVRASAQSLRVDARQIHAAAQETNKEHATATKQAACDAESCGECCKACDECCNDAAAVAATDCFQEMIGEWTRMFGGELKTKTPPAKCEIEPRTAKAVEGSGGNIGVSH